MKYTAFVFILVLAASLGACKKKKISYTVEGIITDASFSQPLSGATVQLYGTPAGSSTPSQLLGTATTGSDGKYSFTFDRDKTEEYIIIVNKSQYFEATSGFTAESLSSSETNTRNVTTTAKSWVKLRFINLQPDAADELKYIRQNGKSGCVECCYGGDQYLYGAVDTAIYCINDGNTTYGYYYWVLNTPNNGPKSIVTVPFDTVELVLNY
ncbi:MAG TPA: carboxypeptidase-like regulatory domain-containing protein [Fluviicola sp.]|nr:carboxypeptidase-like regulatory domain-containing protein [Fluviicola sp.]